MQALACGAYLGRLPKVTSTFLWQCNLGGGGRQGSLHAACAPGATLKLPLAAVPGQWELQSWHSPFRPLPPGAAGICQPPLGAAWSQGACLSPAVPLEGEELINGAC